MADVTKVTGYAVVGGVKQEINKLTGYAVVGSAPTLVNKLMAYAVISVPLPTATARPQVFVCT